MILIKIDELVSLHLIVGIVYVLFAKDAVSDLMAPLKFSANWSLQIFFLLNLK